MSVNIFKTCLSTNKSAFNFKTYQKILKRYLFTKQVHPNVVVSDTTDVDIPNVTITEFLYPKLETFEKYTASVCASTGRSYTFGQIRRKSKNLSKALRHIFKLKKGDKVGLFLSNKPEHAIIFLALLDAGLPVTTLNPLYTSAEVSKQLKDSSAKLIITQSQLIKTVREAFQTIKKFIPILAIKAKQSESLPEGIVDFEELVNLFLDIPDVDVSPGDLAILPYSSGTTGLPKGVELTHLNIISNICQIKHEEYDYTSEPTESYQDVTPAVLPFFHIYGMVLTVFGSLYNGTQNIVLEKFSPELYISVLKNNPVSLIYAAPPMVLFLASNPEVKSEHFQRLKLINSGAAPLGFLDEERILKKFPNKETKITQGYGLTETSPVVSIIPKNMKRSEKNSGSIGKPLPNTSVKIIAIDDTTGTPLGPLQHGELLVKGPQVMRGYYKREEETKNVFLDGWFRTGDIAYYNEDKLLFITDRLKELIKVKGFQVAPAELEQIIRDHSCVEDVAVIGIPHDQYGEVPRAYVVPKESVSLNTEEIRTFVAQKVAKYKELAGGVKIVDSIPRNASGKILRRRLKLNYIEKGF